MSLFQLGHSFRKQSLSGLTPCEVIFLSLNLNLKPEVFMLCPVEQQQISEYMVGR